MGPIGPSPWGVIRYVGRLRKVGRSARSGGAAGQAGFCFKARTSAVFFLGVPNQFWTKCCQLFAFREGFSCFAHRNHLIE